MAQNQQPVSKPESKLTSSVKHRSQTPNDVEISIEDNDDLSSTQTPPPQQDPDTDPPMTFSLICPDENFTKTMLRNLLISNGLNFFSVRNLDNFVLAEFISLQDYTAARSHPALADFNSVSTYKSKFRLIATNLPPNFVSDDFYDLLIVKDGLTVVIHSRNGAERPSATLTFNSQLDYDNARQHTFINWGDFTLFINDPDNTPTHTLSLYGIPSEATEPELGRALFLSQVKAAHWHIHTLRASQLTASAFVYFHDKQDAENASTLKMELLGVPLRWLMSRTGDALILVSDQSICWQCYPPKPTFNILRNQFYK